MEMAKESKEKYFEFFYSNSMLRYFQNWGHIVTEQFLPAEGLVLDLGAGTSEHQNFAKPTRKYVTLDMDLDVLRIGHELGRSHMGVQAYAQALPFADGAFYGVVSVYSLEHLANLDSCVSEVARILKPAGVLAMAIPTEGAMFRLGRRLVTARFAVKSLGFKSIREYEDFVQSRHINTLEQIVSSLECYFQLVEKRWFPFFIGGKILNINMGIKAIRKERGGLA